MFRHHHHHQAKYLNRKSISRTTKRVEKNSQTAL